jgi:DNA-binding transcriptional LysR family regulator
MQREAIHGRLSVGVPEDYAAPYLTPVLREFARRHAGVELTLVCEQSTVLIPRVLRGEVDIAVVTRDRAGRGRLLFEEPLVWTGSPRSEAWRATPLPLAVYEPGSRARRRPFRIVCDTASPAGMLAAVDSGLAVALLSRCSVPAGFDLLDEYHGLPALPVQQVVLLRSRACAGSAAADAMESQVLQTLGRH